MKKRILLSGKWKVENYVNAVNALGAEGTVYESTNIDTSYDGVIFCGGADIHPKYYGEEIDGSKGIDVKNDESEFELLKAYVEAGKPIMGICRGHQLINVFFGGSLTQHIPCAELHVKINDNAQAHNVKAVKGSILEKLYGEEFSVNSSHHQAVNRLGDGLVATAMWDDKYIEAFEHKNLPIIGVQWHPERMCFEFSREDTVDGAKIIKYFIDLC